jgi:hypothetical protein
MVADTFSEEYIFFSNFYSDRFLLGTALKKRWVNHPPAIQKRVTTTDASYLKIFHSTKHLLKVLGTVVEQTLILLLFEK